MLWMQEAVYRERAQARTMRWCMRFVCWWTLALVFLAGCGDETGRQEGEAAREDAAPTVSIEDAAPPSASAANTTFQDLEGNPLELSDFAGKKVFLNYWATWCAPCIREIPSIQRASEALEEEGFVFLFASDESVETIRDFLDEHEFEGNFIKLNAFFAAHGVEAVPSSTLYDEQGNPLETWLGAYEWDSPEMLEELRSL